MLRKILTTNIFRMKYSWKNFFFRLSGSFLFLAMFYPKHFSIFSYWKSQYIFKLYIYCECIIYTSSGHRHALMRLMSAGRWRSSSRADNTRQITFVVVGDQLWRWSRGRSRARRGLWRRMSMERCARTDGGLVWR